MKKILSLGSIAIDIILDSDSLPEDDGFAFINEQVVRPGGSAANVSVSSAGFGMDVYQTGLIGDDEAGSIFRKTLVKDGVNDKYLFVKNGGTTMQTYIITAPKGKHTIFVNIGNCLQQFKPDKFKNDIMQYFDLYYTDMFSPLAALWLAEKSEEKKIPIVYNMQAVPSFMETCGTELVQIKRMLNMCTLLISGMESYFELSGETSDIKKALRKVWDVYKPKDGVICTLGNEGSIWYDGVDFICKDTYKVEVKDTTGAGDCFTGGLIYSYYEKNYTKGMALDFANASAALKCMVKGPRNSVKEEKVLEFKDLYNKDR